MPDNPLTMEYCVIWYREPDEPFRGPWPLEKCQNFIKMLDAPDPHAFYVAKRVVTQWQRF